MCILSFVAFKLMLSISGFTCFGDHLIGREASPNGGLVRVTPFHHT